MMWSLCSSARCSCCFYVGACKRQVDRLRFVDKSNWRKIGENGLHRRWKLTITVLLSLPCCAVSPHPRKSRSMRQQAAITAPWWREIYDHCHWDCVSTGHSTSWPSASPLTGIHVGITTAFRCTLCVLVVLAISSPAICNFLKMLV